MPIFLQYYEADDDGQPSYRRVVELKATTLDEAVAEAERVYREQDPGWLHLHSPSVLVPLKVKA